MKKRHVFGVKKRKNYKAIGHLITVKFVYDIPGRKLFKKGDLVRIDEDGWLIKLSKREAAESSFFGVVGSVLKSD